jgi:hypothetical protein
MKSKATKFLNSLIKDDTTKGELDVIDFLKKCVNQFVEKEKASKPKFQPPTLAEVEQYVREKNYNVDVARFMEYYTTSEWHDNNGKPIKNWKLKLLVWNRPKQNNFTSFKAQEKKDNGKWEVM